MKKNLLASLLVNIILLIVVVALFKKYSTLKTELRFSKGSISVSQKNKDIVEIDKADPIYIYNSKKFACDTLNDASIGFAICSLEKLKFAEELLNKTVKSRMNYYSSLIKRHKEGVLKAKDNSYFVNELRITILSQENFIKTQKVWEEMRVLNSQNVRLGCDGGSGCAGTTNTAEINYILERIKKIK